MHSILYLFLLSIFHSCNFPFFNFHLFLYILPHFYHFNPVFPSSIAYLIGVYRHRAFPYRMKKE